MSAREFAVPVLAGLAVALALWVWAPTLGGDAPEDPDASDAPDLIWPFAQGRVVDGDPDANLRALALGDMPASLPLDCDDAPPPASATATVGEGTPRVGFVDVPAGCRVPGFAAVAVEAPEAPTGLFNASRHGVRLTVFVFDADGLLLASNAPAAEQEPFPAHPDKRSVQLENRTWHVGRGPTPDGMASLPVAIGTARDALEGLPVGGVASAAVHEHPYRHLVGPLYVTVQIDVIVPIE